MQFRRPKLSFSPVRRRAAGRSRRLSRLTALVAALVAVVAGTLTTPPAAASPGQEYSGAYFGDGNFPPGCTRDYRTSPDNVCHRIKTDINPLDSPKVDVLVLAPSHKPERHMRIARQAVEMWDGGIDYLAPQMGLKWLADGMEFHITVDTFDPTGQNGGEFTTYPVVDPEIVVILENSLGGIGTDPAATVDRVEAHVEESVEDSLVPLADNTVRYFNPPEGTPRLGDFVVLDETRRPCHSVQNPFDFEYWKSLPGFDSHHEERSGTYVEECGGAGGNVCFSINGTSFPSGDDHANMTNLFDLVAHETGHCLSLGHVGDGADSTPALEGTPWGMIPYGDIMSYMTFPVGRHTCASTLDVEGLAVRMSRYLDVNGDGAVNGSDRLLANDQVGVQDDPLQVQHRDDHFYASGTGSVLDCPQADLGLLPGERTDWTPEPVDTVDHLLSVSSPADGAVSDDGRFDVAGVLDRRSLHRPTNPTTSYEDASGDSSMAETDILGVDVDLTPTHLSAILRLAELPTFVVVDNPHPWTSVSHPVTYGIEVNNAQGATTSLTNEGPVNAQWDWTKKTVTFEFSREQLRAGGPYESRFLVRAYSSFRNQPEDDAPEHGNMLTVADPAPSCGDPCPDADGDGVGDRDDRCPGVVGNGADGCVIVATEHVHLYVDGVRAGTQDVDTSKGKDTFSLPVDLAEGTHELRVDWEDRGEVVATKSVTVTHNTDDDGDGVPNGSDACLGFDDRADEDDDGVPDACDPDLDGDGRANGVDNCPEKRNADQADLDADGTGDACDDDIDGDGHSNGREKAKGTDPADPNSYPLSPKLP